MTKDGLRRTNFWVKNLNSDNSISGISINGTSGTFTNSTLTTINNTNITITGSLTPSRTLQSYEDANGNVVNNIPAAAVISGGMWVTVYAGSATTPVPLAKPGPANAGQPMGIALATTASGANVPILTRGFYKGLIAEASLSSGTGFSAGAGAALNTIKAAAAGTTRGTVVMGGGSEAVTSVYLW